jgi:hypothetical protein
MFMDPVLVRCQAVACPSYDGLDISGTLPVALPRLSAFSTHDCKSIVTAKYDAVND